MPEKNSIYKVEIADVNRLGYGVSRIDGMAVFVAGGVTGELCDVRIIKVAKSYGVGRIEKLYVPSPLRAEQTCPVYKQCGGCVFRHIDRKYELELKRSFVMTEFKKVGLSPEVMPVSTDGRTERYRNKAQFPVDSSLRAGFYKERTHEICEADDCLLQPKAFSEIKDKVLAFARENGISGYDEKTGNGILRHINLRASKDEREIALTLVINADDLPKRDLLVEKLKTDPRIKSVSLNINKENTNVITGRKYVPLFGKDSITDTLLGCGFEISQASFYQTNRGVTELLYSKVHSLVRECEGHAVADLYCGIGTIGITLAKALPDISLYGVEIVPEAVENAKRNALRNGLKNASFLCADSADADLEVLKKCDTVIVDPPRSGISRNVADKLVSSGAKNIVYVSCAPDTLARDVRYLCDNGFSADKAFPFDMFPRTGHVETVCLLTRKKGQPHFPPENEQDETVDQCHTFGDRVH